MTDVLALPAATAPPTMGVRPSAQLGAGSAPDATGGPPFRDVLAGAESSASGEAAPETEAESPGEGAATVLAALAALLQPLTAPLPADTAAPEVALAVEPQGGAPATPSPMTAQAADIQTAEPESAAPASAAMTPEFALALKAALTHGDVALASTEALAAQEPVAQAPGVQAAPEAPIEGKAASTGIATAQVATKSTLPIATAHVPQATDEAPPALTGAAPVVNAAGSVNIEPARLAEAQKVPAALTNPDVVLPQVVRGVETLAKSGQTALHVQLYPEALGRIDVQLTAGADGMRVTLTANLPATSALLQHNLGDLRQTLLETGLNVSALSVGVGQGQSGSAFGWGRPGAAPQSFSAPLGSSEPIATEAVSAAPSLNNGSHVDYRI